MELLKRVVSKGRAYRLPTTRRLVAEDLFPSRKKARSS